MTFVLLTLLACFPEIRGPEEKRFVDNPDEDFDEDGFTENEGDCNDRNPDINPDVEEICDGIDNNCNDLFDDNATDMQKYYLDADEDGFGIESVSEFACSSNRSENFVLAIIRAGEMKFDCDDSKATVNPDQQEVCGDNLDNDCDGGIDNLNTERAQIWYRDRDGDSVGDFDTTTHLCTQPDGYVFNFGDCDDEDSMIHPYIEGVPGGIELCDDLEVDENCNGTANEASAQDAPLWYLDSDTDGYGDTFIVQPACIQPEQYVTEPGDCDDSNSLINPDVEETCNDVDDDCDGLVNEGEDSTAPLGSSTFYEDTDGDGYGNPNATLIQCSVSVGYVSDNTDCDDSSTSVNPNASEYCNDVDDDCDGAIDEADALQQSQWYADADGDGYGTSLDTVNACPYNQPVGYIEPSTSLDCDDSDPNTYPTAAEICDSVDNDCDGLIDDADVSDLDITLGLSPGQNYYLDDDSDGFGDINNTVARCQPPVGYVQDATDCNDTLSSVNPDADELCDGVDNNCDGSTDDATSIDQITFYLDQDGDGFGDDNPTTAVSQCITVPLLGYISNNFDCNDGDAAINPDTMWYLDADQDGFGTEDFAFQSCSPPIGYTSIIGDCNDLDVNVKPGLPVEAEICNGKVDRCENHLGEDSQGNSIVPSDEDDIDGDGYVECEIDSSLAYNPDGSVNNWGNSQSIIGGLDCDPNMSTTFPNNCPDELDPALCYQDDDEDGYGDENPRVLSFQGQVMVGQDCDDTDFTAYPNAVEICNGVFESCTHPDLQLGFSAPLEELDDDGDGYVECEGYDPNLWEGVSIIGGGDCNDVSAQTFPGAAPNTSTTDCLTDLDGDGYSDRSWSLCPSVQAPNEAEYIFEAIQTYSDLGFAAEIVGDVDGDGLDDILIGDRLVGYPANAGETYLILGSSLSSNSTVNVSTADYTFTGISGGSLSGSMLNALGDIDGDGFADFAILSGSSLAIVLGGNLGTIGAIHLSQADYMVVNSSYGSDVTVSSAGDVDLDGLDDILVGEPNEGKAYLILGSSLGSVSTLSDADYVFVGEQSGDRVSSVSGAGDVDNDGIDDLLIGVATNSEVADRSGKAYLILGSTLGVNSTVELSTVQTTFVGQYQDFVGHQVNSAGDVDADGFDDFMIYASNYDDPNLMGGQNYGRGYLFWGADVLAGIALSTNTTFTGDSGFGPGASITSGDVDADGYEDIVIGSCGGTCTGSGQSNGKVLLYLGANILPNTDYLIQDAEYRFEESSFNLRFGKSVSSRGDVNGDGQDDILVGAIVSNTAHLFSACPN